MAGVIEKLQLVSMKTVPIAKAKMYHEHKRRKDAQDRGIGAQ
jgi:hypothetical protein